MAEDLLRPQDLKVVMQRYLERLREHREAINRLNVYPVPDGDTGTNMTLTVESVVAAMDGTTTMADLAHAMAHGSLMGAQGNSGIILSQVLRALADTFREHPAVDAAQMTEGLQKASAAAYRAVGRPVEGTILTVLRRAAEAAGDARAPHDESLAGLLGRVYEQAERTLWETPDLLPVLKEAGVVDAGGAGLLLLLAALLEYVGRRKVTLPPNIFRPAAQLSGDGRGGDGDGRAATDLRYEVMFLLEGEDGAGDRLKEAWRPLGDSIVVVGGEGTWNCHIHTMHIGAAVEAGIAAGRPHRIQVTDLADETAAEDFHRAAYEFQALPQVARAKVGLVAVANGQGVVERFRRCGAQGVVIGGPTMNPSVGDLLEVVEAVAAKTVVVLPNNKNIIPAAEELDSLTTKQVCVVPTRSVPQGIAAALAYAPNVPADALVPRMEGAARSVRTGELTRAVRGASTPAGPIAKGDWLGLVDGKVAVIRRAGPGRAVALLSRLLRLLLGTRRFEARVHKQARGAFAGALIGLLDRVVDQGAEVVDILAGVDADEAVTRAAVAWLGEHRPEASVDVIDGGQPLYPYIVGVE